ncbi:sigma 54-interacting transcriptional regulator [Alicyclobacillus tolerans]|uniref:sigma 54-interacting transcriptional regulator n=1 Tax=Alicyclobacillus tolerans TaxID=90970 RepID=UPI003B7F2ADF
MNLIVLGAGQGGEKVLKTLAEYRDLQILCVVDKRPEAPGMLLAEQLRIPTAPDVDSALQQVQGQIDVILEVTGHTEVYMRLLERFPERPIVVPASALQFFMLIMSEKERLIASARTRQRDLQRILNATQDGMIGIDAGGRVTLCNAAAERMLGVSSATMRGRKAHTWIPLEVYEPILQGKDSPVTQMRSQAGTDLVVHALPMDDETLQRAGALVVLRDVTEVHRLAAEVTNLREVQQLLEAIIQSTQDAISVVDQNGIGWMINPAYTRLTGLPPERVIGQPAEVDIAEGESMHMQVLRTGQAVRNVPLKVGPLRKEVIVDVAPIWVGNELRGSVGVIHDVSEIKQLTDELQRANRLIRSLSAKYRFEDIVGSSQAVIHAIDQARKAAATSAPVLLRGEPGTGKELFAHAIHQESQRAKGPFVRVNCALFSEEMLEIELFGLEEGASSSLLRGRIGLLEEASGGTLFLDEIGEMSVSTQAKLLRVLQEKELVRVGGTRPIAVDVRLISATHLHLEQAVAAGRFREDLYYRINVIPIFIPPLRYRKEDIEELAKAILQRQNQAFGRNVDAISKDALQALIRWDWPGNVRELENVLGRAMMSVGYSETTLSAHHLPPLGFSVQELAGETGESGYLPRQGTLNERMQMVEQAILRETLSATGGNKTEAARRLGISVRTLYYKLETSEKR